MDLHGRTAVVTGGAIRVGRQICLELAARGANIVIHYRSSAAAAAELVDRLRSLGVGAVALQGDVSLAADVRRLREEAERAFGRVEVLVNNASTYAPTPFRELTEQQWDESLAVNLKGPFLCAMEFGRWMQDNGGGVIINITDWAIARPYPDYLPYLTAKGGLVTLTRCLARELAPTVRANAIAPGPMLPPDSLGEPEREAAAAGTLVGRWGGPEPIAKAVAFLAESDYVNGVVLPVDGGRLIA